MRKFSVLLAGLLVSTGLSLTAAPAAQAASCEGTYTIVVGGFTDPTSEKTFRDGHISERVTYSATLTSQSAREGVDELNRLIREQRDRCPDQHAKAVGFSEGAAVVHIWVTENRQAFDNVNAVLIADPKRAAGPGAAGLAGQPYSGVVGPPLAGADRDFGTIPTLTLCNDDVICDSAASSGWPGYPENHVKNYDFNVDVYSDDTNGQWFNGTYIP